MSYRLPVWSLVCRCGGETTLLDGAHRCAACGRGNTMAELVTGKVRRDQALHPDRETLRARGLAVRKP